MDTICGICHDELDEDIQTLACGHKYHYNCILQSYINDKISNNNKKKCPYCRKNGGYIELKPNTIPYKDIHQEYYMFITHVKNNNMEEIIKFIDTTKCHAILKFGNNKGLQCKNKPFENSYCKKHT